ncbi:hypothetical protein Taro_035289 [Colocasia esculenta]|uniref:Uncharacterized protein n=1 Tax=Colocasia esculenta TaxID=4460 RepID=A0A843VTY9_COLES|nr:hypothetical protein [Colocasia esculenta]
MEVVLAPGKVPIIDRRNLSGTHFAPEGYGYFCSFPHKLGYLYNFPHHRGISTIFCSFRGLYVISHKLGASVQISGQQGHLCHFPPNRGLFYNVAPFMDFRRWVGWTGGGCLWLGLQLEACHLRLVGVPEEEGGYLQFGLPEVPTSGFGPTGGGYEFAAREMVAKERIFNKDWRQASSLKARLLGFSQLLGRLPKNITMLEPPSCIVNINSPHYIRGRKNTIRFWFLSAKIIPPISSNQVNAMITTNTCLQWEICIWRNRLVITKISGEARGVVRLQNKRLALAKYQYAWPDAIYTVFIKRLVEAFIMG